MNLMDLTWIGNTLLNAVGQHLTRYDVHIYMTIVMFVFRIWKKIILCLVLQNPHTHRCGGQCPLYDLHTHRQTQNILGSGGTSVFS
jgi:hypothetical protein